MLEFLRLKVHVPDGLGIVEALQEAGVILSGAELGIVHQSYMKRYRGLDTLDDKLLHSAVHLYDTLLARLGAADDLG